LTPTMQESGTGERSVLLERSHLESQSGRTGLVVISRRGLLEFRPCLVQLRLTQLILVSSGQQISHAAKNLACDCDSKESASHLNYNSAWLDPASYSKR
jgi:hypothetical protein